jgi:hypothetical protein
MQVVERRAEPIENVDTRKDLHTHDAVDPGAKQLGTTDPIKVLYIAGWQRSGSTILANLLGQIHGFFSAGELYYLWDFVWQRNTLCGCGRHFHDCPTWARIVERAFGGPGGVDSDEMRRLGHIHGRTRAFPQLALSPTRKRMTARLRKYLRNLARLYSAIADSTDSRVIVDASKWPSYGRVLDMVACLDVRVVHLVRDPRAVAYSWLRRKVLADRDPPEEMYRRPADSSLRWNAWNIASELYFKRAPTPYLLLRYEDFVERPRKCVKRILELLGEDATALPFVSARQIELGVTHTVGGNPVRLASGRVRLQRDDEWTREMRLRDRALVDALTYPLLRKYGYARESLKAPARGPRARSAA